MQGASKCSVVFVLHFKKKINVFEPGQQLFHYL